MANRRSSGSTGTRVVGHSAAVAGDLPRCLAAVAGDVPVAVCVYDDVAQVAGVGCDPDGVFRIASVTKTFVAAAVLRLVELDRVRLDDRAVGYLRPALAELVVGACDVDGITIGRLLRHTAGLADHAADTGWQQRVRAEPQRAWTREEQVGVALALAAPAAPGEAMHYSDTGYVLLGEVVEVATGCDLATAVRSLLNLDALALRHTWWELLEPAPVDAPDWAAQCWDGLDVRSIHPTVDLFGGGGIVSTVRDLATFFRRLVGGDVLSSTTLKAMLTPSAVDGNQLQMGCGIFALPFKGGEWWGHTGFWNVCAAAQVGTGRAVVTCVLRTPPGAPLATEIAARLVQASG